MGSEIRRGDAVEGPPRPRVAVTAAAGAAGTAVTRALLAAAEAGGPGAPAAVVALDTVRGDVDGATWRTGDLTTPQLAARLRDVDVVVHLACPTDLAAALGRRSRDRRGEAERTAQAVLTAAAAVGVRRVVAVTSAMVHGALPGAPVPLPEDAPLLEQEDDGLVGDLLVVERLLRTAAALHPQTRVTVLRPAALVGPGVDTVVTRHFEAPRLLQLREVEMRWQLCHVDDLASAVVRVVRDDLDGPLTVGCEGSLGVAEVEALTGMRRVELPAALAVGTAERLHRAGVLPMPVEDLAYVTRPWVVSSQRLRAAGWRPRHDNASALVALLAQARGRHAVVGLRVERRDATVGAAGAAVALVATAAVLRQARARRRPRG